MSFINDLMNVKDGVWTSIGADGQEVVVQIGKEATDFISENKKTLQRMGKQSFISILYLVQSDKQIEAEIELIKQMDAWELIEKMNANADDIERIAKLKDEWNVFLKNFLIKISKAAAGALLKILL